MEREIEEREVMMIDDEEEESSSFVNSCKRRRREMGLKLDDFISGGSLRVLLIEGDDSTRQIIAALLRKCNYKVAAVADGLKAWDILKEKARSIDVILMEVELPSLPGVDLLSLIMGHEICKHIPVIMISYNDSVNMVYKCMLKGAADFLVKPVRKNELRNLWQHVWRRRKLSDVQEAIKNVKGDDTKKKLENVENNKECSEKKSYTESCKSSDMEAQSIFKQNRLPLGDTSPISENLLQNSRAQDHHDSKEHAIPQLPEEEYSCAEVENTANQDAKPIDSSAEIEDRTCIDLIGGINNQQQLCYGLTDSNAVSHNVNYMRKSDSPPHLELSLKRYGHASNNMEEDKSDSHALNHSNSSPFSLYTNSKNQVSREGTYTQSDANEYNYAPCTNQTSYDTSIAASMPNNIATKCTPIRVIPQQFPFGGGIMKPTLYPGSSQNLWSPNATQSNAKLDYYGSKTERVYKELRDEGSGICNGSSTNGNNTSTNVSYSDRVEKKEADLCRLTQREVALNKFRLKRKERCFEKKVRYQSRKKLAEQRPRVKGQFVKHVQS